MNPVPIESASAQEETTQLSPSYNISLGFIFTSIPLAWFQVWVGGAIALFGLFLLWQTFTIRLQFTSTALDIYRSNELIRSFPYVEWENWQIFWQPVPILLYFKEIKSIHFLPIIFDAPTLTICLEKYCPRKN